MTPTEEAMRFLADECNLHLKRWKFEGAAGKQDGWTFAQPSHGADPKCYGDTIEAALDATLIHVSFKNKKERDRLRHDQARPQRIMERADLLFSKIERDE